MQTTMINVPLKPVLRGVPVIIRYAFTAGK
jgi:hypothetical protein